MTNKSESGEAAAIYDITTSYPMKLKECIMLLQETLNRRFKEAGYRITHKQWQILTFVRSKEGLSQKELATMYKSSKVAIVRFLDRLEEDGLVLRENDFRDKRRNRILLTEKGRALQEELAPIALDNANRMREGLDDADVEKLIGMLGVIASNGKK